MAELQRVTAEMQSEIEAAKKYFAEDAKLSAEEFFSRWATFIGQIETAVHNQQADAKKQSARK